MNVKFHYLKWLVLLVVCIFLSQVQAQEDTLECGDSFIAGVSHSCYRQKVNSSPAWVDTLYSFPTPGNWPSGLAWDGESFWACDASTALLYRITASGEILSSFPLPEGSTSGGLVWDGNYLWFADEALAILYKIDKTSGQVIQQFNLPSFGSADPNGFGLAWDGQYLWHSQYEDSAMIFKIDPQNGQVISQFAPPSNWILGITWKDDKLYGLDLQISKLFVLDPGSGIVLDSIPWIVPYALDLAWDGIYFWNVSGSIAIGGRESIYKIEGFATSIENPALPSTGIISLFQNYPNPFTHTTTIRYTLLKSSNVTVTIYNQLGQKIETVVNARQSAGTYSIQWGGGDRQEDDRIAGVYFYHLQADTFIKTQKMLLQR